jgi:hypothetical protein
MSFGVGFSCGVGVVLMSSANGIQCISPIHTDPDDLQLASVGASALSSVRGPPLLRRLPVRAWAPIREPTAPFYASLDNRLSVVVVSSLAGHLSGPITLLKLPFDSL